MKINIFNNLLLIFFTVYPISILIGNSFINFNIFIISSIFVVGLLLNKFDLVKQKITFYLILFFFISLVINLFFSNDLLLSYPRVIKVFFVIFFVIAYGYVLNNLDDKEIKNLYKIWTLIFLLITLDLLVEYINGSNIIGLSSVFPGKRLGSFTGTESVIGHYYLGFSLIALSYAKLYFKTKNLDLFLALIFIIFSFLIGERANFIRTFIIISLYSFLLYESKLKFKFLAIISIVSFFIIFLNFNENYKKRYYGEIGLIFQKGINSYLENSSYGSHRNVAKEIFKDNPIFGAGIKNFRVESSKSKYDDLDHKQNHLRVSTHPHELYYEFLSETGIFGLLSFLIFILISLYFSIRNYLISKNIFQLSSILFILSAILPILPSGSFLSTFSSSIFWINYAIMMGYNTKYN